MRDDPYHDPQENGRPTVAVVVACYNQAKFLAEALTSVSAQIRPADEVILIDDGSSDDTRQVAARFPAINYVYQDNAGLSAARNAGLALVTSRYVLFVDSDDLLAPDALRAALGQIINQPGCAFVYGSFREVDAEGALIRVHRLGPRADPFRALLQEANYIAMPGTVLYNAAILRASGGFDTTLPSCEDYDVYLRLARHHPIAHYDAIAADYRRHGQSMSRNALRMIETSHAVLDRHARTLPERNLARQGKAIMNAYYTSICWQTLRTDIQRGRLRALREVVRAVRRSPHLIKALSQGTMSTLRSKLRAVARKIVHARQTRG